MMHSPELIAKAREELLAVRKGLLVVQTAFLGDVVLLTPLLRAAKRAFPDAPLAAAVIPQCREVVEGWVDRVIEIDKRTSGGNAWGALFEEVEKGGYAAALLPHRSFTTGRNVRRAGIPLRIGFDRGEGRWFHSIRVPYEGGLYEGRRNLGLLQPLADVVDDGIPELKLPPRAFQAADKLLADVGIGFNSFAVIAPASVWRTKKWGSSQYRRLTEALLSDFRIRTLAVGGNGDSDVCSAAVADQRFNLAGRLAPLESAALLSRARFVLSGDSAAAHLATAVKARQIIIFGSTAPRFGFAPPTPNARFLGIDLWCRPCSDHGRQRCPIGASPRCLDEVTPEMVTLAARDWLEPIIA